MDHIRIAEAAFGKPLPHGVHVHHVDGNRLNNQNTNLVICTPKYHKLIHRRTDAYLATGDANLLKCGKCKNYDSQMNLRPRGKETYVHLECERAYWKTHRAILRGM
jgi:hypothetical protein